MLQTDDISFDSPRPMLQANPRELVDDALQAEIRRARISAICEARDRHMACGREDPDAQLLDESREHPTHEPGEPGSHPAPDRCSGCSMREPPQHRANPIQHRVHGGEVGGRDVAARLRDAQRRGQLARRASRTAEQVGAVQPGALPRLADVARDRFGSAADLVGE